MRQVASKREKTVLVTGASGYIGRTLCNLLTARGFSVIATARSPLPNDLKVDSYVRRDLCRDLASDLDWHDLLLLSGAVIHLANRVHVTYRVPLGREKVEDQQEMLAINLDATRRLAEQALASQVPHFIHLSSLLAKMAPEGNERSYITSKQSGERALVELKGKGLPLTILRPPMVYGPQAPGNFASLAKALKRGLPLPLAGIENKRSFIYLGNLCDALLTSLSRGPKAGHLYELSDGEPCSTSSFTAAMAKAMDRKALLFPCPAPLLGLLGRATGRKGLARSLTGDLVAEDQAFREDFGWAPPYSRDEALRLSLDEGAK